MIRISHSELAAAQQDFAAWWRLKQAPATEGRRLGYAQAVKLAIYKYHSLQSNRGASLAHFDQLVAARLTNAQRIAQARLQLHAYIDWAERSAVIVADHRVRLNLPLERDVVLGGEVSRIDLEPKGYRAVLLMARVPARWQQESRMPLIQLAVAYKYQRSPDDVSVVTSPYKVDGEVVGTVGVIGPTRMAYERVVPRTPETPPWRPRLRSPDRCDAPRRVAADDPRDDQRTDQSRDFAGFRQYASSCTTPLSGDLFAEFAAAVA